MLLTFVVLIVAIFPFGRSFEMMSSARKAPSFRYRTASSVKTATLKCSLIPVTHMAALGTGLLTKNYNLATAILVPSSLGYFRREYGVSYGYGGSMAAAAYLSYKNPLNSLNKAHSLLHLVYGIRLIAYLLFRELTIPRFREMRERIERNSPKTRIARTPFILQCAMLYFFMSLPVVITSQVPAPPPGSMLSRLSWGALGVSALGLVVNIIGDLHKTIAKLRGRSLVMGGLYSFLRHPNYTGELFLWSFSSIVSLLVACSAPMWTMKLGLQCAGSVLGAFGIAFILALAATGLERRQREAYGSNTYDAWVKKTWGGLTLAKKDDTNKTR